MFALHNSDFAFYVAVMRGEDLACSRTGYGTAQQRAALQSHVEHIELCVRYIKQASMTQLVRSRSCAENW